MIELEHEYKDAEIEMSPAGWALGLFRYLHKIWNKSEDVLSPVARAAVRKLRAQGWTLVGENGGASQECTISFPGLPGVSAKFSLGPLHDENEISSGFF